MLYNIKEIDNDNEIDVTNITNYQNYFDTNSVKVKEIYKVILQFIGYHNDKKIEMMNIYNTIQDIAKELNIGFDNVINCLKTNLLIMIFVLVVPKMIFSQPTSFLQKSSGKG